MLFSVITVCFNSAKTIARTFDSVLAQDSCDYEYIVVDGGSSDGTVKIIEEYEPRFAGRMHWISEPDNGIYDAMNKGIGMAQGELLWMLNSDDAAEPGALAAVAAAVAAEPAADVYYGIERMLDGAGCELGVHRGSHLNMPWQSIHHQAAFIRRGLHDLIGRYRGEMFPLAADYDFFLRAFLAHGKFVPVDSILALYSQDGISSRSRCKYLSETWRSRYQCGCLTRRQYCCECCLSPLKYLYGKAIDFTRKQLRKNYSSFN